MSSAKPLRAPGLLDMVGDPEAFREAFRTWLDAALDKDWRAKMTGANPERYREMQLGWLEQMRRVGLATPHWPKEWGGADLPLRYQIIVYEELARADSPALEMMVVSLYHLPATLFEYGSAAQRDRYLGGVLNGNDIWCQGFSEPGSGSDLASLKTRAERRGDRYIVNGQKIWSSNGMFADYCLLLARTNPAAERKQQGISYFILDMKSPGVTVRPIRQITGDAEFAEIFLDDVAIPAGNLIGAENNGWAVAQSTLSAERGLLIFSLAERLACAYERDLESGRDSWMKDDQLRREFAAFHPEIRATCLLIRRMLGELEHNPDASSSSLPMFIKLKWAPLLQRYTEFLVRAEALDGNWLQHPISGGGYTSGQRMNDFLKSYAWTIAGGTNEVMRNLIAEKVLGLPRG